MLLWYLALLPAWIFPDGLKGSLGASLCLFDSWSALLVAGPEELFLPRLAVFYAQGSSICVTHLASFCLLTHSSPGKGGWSICFVNLREISPSFFLRSSCPHEAGVLLCPPPLTPMPWVLQDRLPMCVLWGRDGWGVNLKLRNYPVNSIRSAAHPLMGVFPNEYLSESFYSMNDRKHYQEKKRRL